MSQKDFKKWNWEKITDLIDGSFQNTKRLEDAMSTKFIKRLLKFYLPSKNLFVSLPYTAENLIYAKVGYKLLKLLLNFKPGQEQLKISFGVHVIFGMLLNDENKEIILTDSNSYIGDIGKMI